MGDIWPFGPPHRVSFDDAANAAHGAGFSLAGAKVMAAIATAESGRDTTVVNDTPATGDYSVGAWQINYYGTLRAGRVAQFGRPGQLARSGITGQARAAYAIWQQQGLDAWSTYTSGAYLQYLSGGTPPGTPIGAPQQLPDTRISPPTEDYSATVRAGAESVRNWGNGWHDAAVALRNLRR